MLINSSLVYDFSYGNITSDIIFFLVLSKLISSRFELADLILEFTSPLNISSMLLEHPKLELYTLFILIILSNCLVNIAVNK